MLVYAAVVTVGVALAVRVAMRGNAMYDFKGGLYNAGVAILHGHTFYRPVFLAHQAAIMHAGGIARGELVTNPFSIPVYPAFANLIIVPLALLPFWLAASIYTAASILAMAAGIWLLGVRDWRCFALVLISWPFLFGALLGAIGPFLVLGAGIAWRWRDRVWPPALAIAAIVAAKVFPWPLGVWLLITRRWKAAALCVALGLLLTLGAWALIGFQGMARYPEMLANMSYLQEDRAISLATVLVILGLPAGAASACVMLAGAGLLGLAWRLAKRPDGDRQAFGLAVIAALTATPIVWEHYMVLLFVPIALASPRLSRLWLVPLATPVTGVILSMVDGTGVEKAHPFSAAALQQSLVWLSVEAIVVAGLCTTRSQRHATRIALTGTILRLRPAALAPTPGLLTLESQKGIDG
jgi:hypothetical protein